MAVSRSCATCLQTSGSSNGTSLRHGHPGDPSGGTDGTVSPAAPDDPATPGFDRTKTSRVSLVLLTNVPNGRLAEADAAASLFRCCSVIDREANFCASPDDSDELVSKVGRGLVDVAVVDVAVETFVDAVDAADVWWLFAKHGLPFPSADSPLVISPVGLTPAMLVVRNRVPEFAVLLWTRTSSVMSQRQSIASSPTEPSL
jgi:hypothetical protein